VGSCDLEDVNRKEDAKVKDMEAFYQSVESLGKEMKISVISVLVARPMEVFSYWFGDDIRNSGSIILPAKGCWSMVCFIAYVY